MLIIDEHTGQIEVRRIEVVGPTVSSELKRTGVIAVIGSTDVVMGDVDR